MGKYSKGVRVRLIKQYEGSGPLLGALGTVFAKSDYDKGARDVIWDDDFVDGHDGEACDGSNNHYYVPKSHLEIVIDEPTTTETWVPKVGDRVRFKDNFIEGEGVIVAPVDFESSSFDWTVRGDGDPVSYFYEDRRFDFPTRLFAASDLEPLPVAAEAQPAVAGLWAPVVGKYGKTRDGRKVGPAVLATWPSSTCKWSLGEMWLYRDDGTCGSDNPDSDLVAEWIDEPVEVEPVTERKFKVGDVVNYVYDGKRQDCWQGVAITKDDGKLYFASSPANGEGAFYEDWLELAEPVAAAVEVAVAPATATIKVGDRVKSTGNTWTKYKVLAIKGDAVDVVTLEKDGSESLTWTNQPIRLFSLDGDVPPVVEPAANDNNSADHEVTVTVNSAEKANLLRAYADLLNAA